MAVSIFSLLSLSCFLLSSSYKYLSVFVENPPDVQYESALYLIQTIQTMYKHQYFTVILAFPGFIVAASLAFFVVILTWRHLITWGKRGRSWHLCIFQYIYLHGHVILNLIYNNITCQLAAFSKREIVKQRLICT